VRIAGFEITRNRIGKTISERRSGYYDQLIRTAYDAVRGLFGGGGIATNPNTALRLAPVHSCIRVKADSLATMPLKLYRINEQGRRVAYDHPLHTLLQEPNEIQSKFDLIKWVSTQLDLSGNAFVKIYRDPISGYPNELEPIFHGRVSLKVVDEVPYYFIQGEDETEPISSYDILHFKGLTYNNSALGVSLLNCMRHHWGLT
jgi:HK97 family phage portal protein